MSTLDRYLVHSTDRIAATDVLLSRDRERNRVGSRSSSSSSSSSSMSSSVKRKRPSAEQTKRAQQSKSSKISRSSSSSSSSSSPSSSSSSVKRKRLISKTVVPAHQSKSSKISFSSKTASKFARQLKYENAQVAAVSTASSSVSSSDSGAMDASNNRIRKITSMGFSLVDATRVCSMRATISGAVELLCHGIDEARSTASNIATGTTECPCLECGVCGSKMEKSDCFSPSYGSKEYVCDLCDNLGGIESSLRRWTCSRCMVDICFGCRPETYNYEESEQFVTEDIVQQ